MTLVGDPKGVWEREAARDPQAAGLPEGEWLPGPDSLPPWQTVQQFEQNYSAMPSWWMRWLLMIVLLLTFGIVAVSGSLPPWPPETWRETVGFVVVGLLAVGVVIAVVFTLRFELRFRRNRRRWTRELFAELQGTAVPVWVVSEDRVRVSDGTAEGVYDLQFVFDLRVSRTTLALQRRVVEAWLDEVASADDPRDRRLPENFARSAVHCVDIFGEGMRGVWIWDKPSMLPIQVLGLATVDPATTAEFSDLKVVFMKKQSRRIRRRSTIGRR